MRTLLTILTFIMLTSCSSIKHWKARKYKGEVKTADNFELVFDDVDRFWKMYDQLREIDLESKRRKLIKKEYLEKGTDAFKLLLLKDGLSPKDFSKTLRDTAFFNSIRPVVEATKDKTEEIKRQVLSIRTLYPEANFTDVYFVVGNFYHGGTVMNGFMIIEIQKNAKTEDTRSQIFSEKTLNSFIDNKTLNSLLVHEQVHVSQKNSGAKTTLLSQSIREGGADFVMNLITNEFPSHIVETYRYGNEKEFELWQKFQKDKMSPYKEIKKDWFYNYNHEVLPPDLGYWMGFKICEAFYNQAEDKKQAIKEIMENKDFEDLLKRSGYNGGR